MNGSKSAQDIIEFLGLKPLEFEGGYYRETYRSPDLIRSAYLPERYHTDKTLGTAIYYLLTPETRSRLHRLPTDEIYHFYLGDPVTTLLLYPDNRGEVVTLGQDMARDQLVQMVVPAGVWQGSMLVEGGRYALLGITLAPGFDKDDFESAEFSLMAKKYPNHMTLIERLT
ncbi:MAG: cupin domain-containing protein [Candidatus Zixiibacteriota bacterium]